MIETTHIPLAKAAEMLGTDETTLLIAAAEQRIQLYLLLNEILRVYCEGLSDPSMEGEATRHFLFVPVSPYDAASIIQGRGLIYTSFWDGEESFVVVHQDDDPFIPANRCLVFANHEDIRAIISSGLPKEKTVPDIKAKVPSEPRQNTMLATVAALLAAWPKGKIPSGKDLENAAGLVKVNVSDDSIRKVILQAKEMGDFPD